MQEKYLIAVDLDGTLLTDKKTISPKTVEFFNSLHKQGHIVVIATGRPTRAVVEYQKQLGITGPLVSYNGSLTIDYHQNRFPTRRVTLEKDIALQIINEVGLSTFDNLMLETEHRIFLLKEDEDLNTFFWNDKGMVAYGSPNHTLDEDPMTLIFKPHVRSKKVDKLLIDATKRHKNYNLRFWHSSVFSEIYMENATKKDGLEYICKMLNIDHKNTIVCGDAENDIQMMQWANHSVAMSNGIDLIKKVATVVTTKSNNEDGLIEPIKQILGL